MGYLVLALAAISYAVGIVAQTVGTRRIERRDGIDLSLLGRLATDRVYLLGFAAQVAGFVLAFLARADLPLYVVQAGRSSSVGLAAVLGAVVFGWALRRMEIVALGLTALGLMSLVSAANPGPSLDLSVAAASALVVLLAVVAGLGLLAVRLARHVGSVALGLLAGLAFAVLAIASRPLADDPLWQLPFRPLTWLMVAAAVVGQGLLAMALQRGSITATMAAVESIAVVAPSVFGILLLGDLVAAGREPWLYAGLGLVVAGVLVMAVAEHRTPAAQDSAPSRGTADIPQTLREEAR